MLSMLETCWDGSVSGVNGGQLLVPSHPTRTPSGEPAIPEPPTMPRERALGGENAERLLRVLLRMRGATMPELVQQSGLRDKQVQQSVWILTGKGMIRVAAQKRKVHGRQYTAYEVIPERVREWVAA